jgi:hypothetical protein
MNAQTTSKGHRSGAGVALRVSLVANLMLVALLWYQAKTLRPAVATPLDADQTISTPVTVSAQEWPNPAASQSRPEPAAATHFDWSQLEAADYRAYIANLRSVRCPERTVREIITADVADLYAQKRQELGLDKAGLVTGRWSRNEEAAFVAALLGGPLDSTPGSKSPGNSSAGQVAASLPLVFQNKALESLSLNDEQKADLEWLRSEFVREIGGLNQNPSDPAYLERWQKAQPKLDDMLIGVIGRDGIIELDQAQH